MYSKLQNVNKWFLDSRLGPTLSCLVAEKSKIPKLNLFIHNNKSLYLPLLFLYLQSSTSSTSSFSHFACSLFNPTFLLSPSPHPDFIKKLCCCGRKVVIWEFSLFLLPSKTEWALVYCPETPCLHSAAFCTYCTEELDQ